MSTATCCGPIQYLSIGFLSLYPAPPTGRRLSPFCNFLFFSPSPAAHRPPRMDASSLAAFENRAAQAEQRLAVLESKLAAGESCWLCLCCCARPEPAAIQFTPRRRPPDPAAAAAAPALPLLPAGSGSSSGGAVDTSRYVAELQSLKAVLLAAKAEQEALEKRVGEVSKRQEQEQPGDHSDQTDCAVTACVSGPVESAAPCPPSLPLPLETENSMHIRPADSPHWPCESPAPAPALAAAPAAAPAAAAGDREQ